MTQTERLIVFTRYPQPGKAKTRLIPALGAVGAAALQRQMTEHTLRQVAEWVDRSVQSNPLQSVEIWFAGTDAPDLDRQRMQDWLGSQWAYRSQPSGDLGERMAQAFRSAFAAGMERVVIIGTDCPGIDANLLAQAFQLLQEHDVVLGPATDGGYYLIGLSRFTTDLFTGIAWSTAEVLHQTVAIATQKGLDIAALNPLTDIDRPEDLPVWEAVCHPSPVLSVIIPVLNEANTIQTVLRNLRLNAVGQSESIEVIVVDGGSQDDTIPLAQASGATVISGETGRANQMNAGAAIATGRVLLFLHADTYLPPGFVSLIQQTLNQPQVVAGAFELRIDGSEPGLRWVERGVNWRSKHCQLPYGDQAIFLTANTFHQLGEFPILPIMEDFIFIRRLQKLGKIAIVPAPVTTSARRWQKLGILQTTLINQLAIVAYFSGISPERIARWYRRSEK
ncbi:TIGR04283 family arsenosugar biosynthesis glycosyltransferase [Egbenema bharatensis]|uniref:TIGR04283 family arsenosugar biosynthesis glycosyltransferase n=1 Tax=Egbenema bharatensis TaxID=3463334 RepID=UPI003A8B5729